MKMIRPIDITNTTLVSSTVSATDPASSGAFNIATTYSTIGQIVQVDNPTFTFTCSASMFTSAGHGFTNGQVINVASSGTLPAGLSSGVDYYLIKVTINTFSLSLTKNGSEIYTTSAGTGTHTATACSHKIYENLVTGNIGNVPHKSPTSWLDLGNTNRWRAFDGSVNSFTSGTTSIQYVVQTSGRSNSVAVMNVTGNSVTVQAETIADGIVYETVYDLRSSIGVSSYYSWFFSEITRDVNFVDTDLPPYLDMKITVTVTASTGETVKCGAIVIGSAKELGGAQYGASVGITDYSVKSKDEFGNLTVTERAYSDKAAFQLIIDRLMVDSVKYELAKYRATPVVYIGSNEYTSTIIYGFYKDFSVTISHPSHSLCSIDIEGLA